MQYQGDTVLNTMSKFAVNRNNSIYSLINHNIKQQPSSTRIRLLEFGAGKGEFIDRFMHNKKIETYAVEINQAYFYKLKKHHKTYKNITSLPTKVDYIFSIDVLEHLKKDEEYLRMIYNSLNENGRLFIYIPARPELYSRFDKHIGHYRRYNLDEIIIKLKRTNFKIDQAYYHDFLGYFAALFNKLTTDGELNPTAVNIYDKYFFPISMLFESVIKPPIGKSIVILAKKM